MSQNIGKILAAGCHGDVSDSISYLSIAACQLRFCESFGAGSISGARSPICQSKSQSTMKFDANAISQFSVTLEGVVTIF